MTDKKNQGFKRSVMEWGGIAAVIAILYFTGWYTVVLGSMQHAMLWTGLFDAETHKVATINGPTLSQSAYNLRLVTPAGDKVRLGNYKGKVLFINLWASWCPPCVAEMPTIETLYDHVSDNENIKFLLISEDRNREKAINFMEGRGFSMPYYFPISGLPLVFQSPYIPTTYVISKEGEIIYKHEGIADYSTNKFRDWLVKQAN